jgi:hypothetical protein
VTEQPEPLTRRVEALHPATGRVFAAYWVEWEPSGLQVCISREGEPAQWIHIHRYAWDGIHAAIQELAAEAKRRAEEENRLARLVDDEED